MWFKWRIKWLIQKKAQQQKYAVGAFNFSDLEQLKAILNASQRLKKDVLPSMRLWLNA